MKLKRSMLRIALAVVLGILLGYSEPLTVSAVCLECTARGCENASGAGAKNCTDLSGGGCLLTGNDCME